MIIKSIVLGLGIFVVGTIAYLVLNLATLPPPPTTPPGTFGATGVALGSILNIWFCWVWLAASIALGYCVARQFSARA